MDNEYKILYNVTIETEESQIINSDILFVRNKHEIEYFKQHHSDKIIEYVPDIRILNCKSGISKNKDTNLSILIEDDIIPPKLRKFINKISCQYTIRTYDEDRFFDDKYIEEIVKNSDLVICRNYISHLFCIIHTIPFISVSATNSAILLLKDIGIENLRYTICRKFTYLINNWVEYKKLIDKHNIECVKYIKLKFNKYNVKYG